MADDDEIDILGDFSFNSCLAQNNQGIPSCSSREDTVHPQWLLDSTATNWYDSDREKRLKLGPARKLSGNSATNRHNRVRHSSWNQAERDLLRKEMAKYGRNVYKISQTLKTKTSAEIQALIEAEHGINLDTPSFGLSKNDEQEDVPNVVQEEIVMDESSISNVLNLVATGSPTIAVRNKHPFRKKSNNKNLKCFSYNNAPQKTDLLTNSPEIFYDDDLIVGSTESIGSDADPTDVVTQKVKQHKEKIIVAKKMGNHRRKVSRNFDRGRPRTSSKELLKSPQQGRKKDSSLSEDITKSPKLQIVLGSGQALPVSEGEQVIKIEKKKDSDSDSDIEVDIDSDDEGGRKSHAIKEEPQCSSSDVNEAPIAVPLSNFEPMPKRRRKINLEGAGGCTIMHTAAGDVYRVAREPRRRPRPRPPRPPAVALLPCPYYGEDPPAPYTVVLGVSALAQMEAHAHTSRAEVMGLLGGRAAPGRLLLAAYRPARAAAGATHCDMDPVSQAEAGAWLRARGLRVLGWHHSHPAFPALPSAQDAATQRALQPLGPFVALVTAQRPPPPRYRSVTPPSPQDAATQRALQPLGPFVALVTAQRPPPPRYRSVTPPSPQDAATQRALQPLGPFVALVTAQRPPPPRYRSVTPPSPQDAATQRALQPLGPFVALVTAQRPPPPRYRSVTPPSPQDAATQRALQPLGPFVALVTAQRPPPPRYRSVTPPSPQDAATQRALQPLGPFVALVTAQRPPPPRYRSVTPPSPQDAATQRALQPLGPFVALVTAQRPPPPRYRSVTPPSPQDAATQRALQPLGPFVALVTAQRPPSPRYRCFHVEEDGSPLGAPRSLRVRLARDVRVAPLLRALRRLLRRAPRIAVDVCPYTHCTYLNKCISSIQQHLAAAGYADTAPEVLELVAGLRAVFRDPPGADPAGPVSPAGPASPADSEPGSDWPDDTDWPDTEPELLD